MGLTDYLAQQFPVINAHWDAVQSRFTAKKVPAGITLLAEGDVATNLYFILSGAARLSHSNDDREITLQFFFENQIVASFESFYLNQPSGFALTCFEDSDLLVLSKTDFDWLRRAYPELEPGKWNRHRYIRWFRLHNDGMRTDQPHLLHDGT